MWHGPRDVDVGEILDVPDREAFLLITAYGYCVGEDGEAPTAPISMTPRRPHRNSGHGSEKPVPASA